MNYQVYINSIVITFFVQSRFSLYNLFSSCNASMSPEFRPVAMRTICCEICRKQLITEVYDTTRKVYCGAVAAPVWYIYVRGRCGIAGPFRDGIYITSGICKIAS